MNEKGRKNLPPDRWEILNLEELFLLGVLGNVTCVVPDHDEHHGHFVKDTNDDWPKDDGEEPHEKRHTAHDIKHTEVSEGVKNYKDCGNVIDYLQDWLNPHNLEC